MAFKLRSSGLPFKEMGSSPVHQGVKEDKFDVDELINQQNTPKPPPKDNKIYGPITEEEHNKVLNKDKNKNTYNPVTPIIRKKPELEPKEDIKKPTIKKPVNDKINKEVGPVSKKKKEETQDWFNVKGYLKGEQGWIPDFEGESTSKTATKASKAFRKGYGKVSDTVHKFTKKGYKGLKDWYMWPSEK